MSDKSKKNFSERELDILQALWHLKKATVADVQKNLDGQNKKLAYTTIQTMLNRLENKGFVVRDSSDRVHLYQAVLKQPGAADNALKRLTQRFFGGSAEALISRLVEKDLTEEQIMRVQSLIEEHRRKKERQK